MRQRKLRGRITVVIIIIVYGKNCLSLRFAEMKWDKKKLEDTVRRFEELMKDNIVLEKVGHRQTYFVSI